MLLFAVLSLLLNSANALQVDVDDHLFWTYSILQNEVTTPSAQRQFNQTTLDEINSIPRPYIHGDEAAFVTYAQASLILRETIANPIAALWQTRRYDPDGTIGFCFGRAMAAHLEAIHRNLDQDAIRKIWAVGDLRSGGTRWGWHVTTIVRGENTWYAVDPIFGKVLTVAEWLNEMYSYDHGNSMLIFSSEASKFGPSPGKYHPTQINDDAYHGYFIELMEYFRQKFGTNR